MANTVNIPIKPEDGWVLVPEDGDAFITFSKSMEYLISDVPPDDTLFGHHLRTFEILTFGSDTENLYVRGEGVVVLTPNSAFNKGGEPRPEGLYTGRRAQTVAFYSEQNVKNGLQFYLNANWPTGDSIGNGVANARNVIFKTGSKKVVIKTRIVSYIGEEFRLELFQGPTYTGGTAIFVGNYNLVNPEDTTVTALKDATLTNPGTPFAGEPDYYYGASTGNRDAKAIPDGRERVLPPNTEFCVRITSLVGTGRFSYFLDWYEGDTDLPIGG